MQRKAYLMVLLFIFNILSTYRRKKQQSISEISVAFGANPLLKNATIAILEGERIGLVGRNGCGKSTFLKMAAGATSPDSGQINTRRGLLVGYLPQEFELEEELTVHEAVLRGASAVQDLLAEYETGDLPTPETSTLKVATLSSGSPAAE